MKRRSSNSAASNSLMSLSEENKLLKKEMLALKQELYALRKQNGEPQRAWGGSWHPPSLSWSSLRAPTASNSQQQLTGKQQQQQSKQSLIHPAPSTLPSRLRGISTTSATTTESSKPRKPPLSPPPVRTGKIKGHDRSSTRNRKNSDLDDFDDDEVSTDGNVSEDVEAHIGGAGLHHRNVTLSPQRNNGENSVQIRRFSDSRLKDDDSDVDDSDVLEPDHQRLENEDGSESTFARSVQDRAGWLVGLLVLQSMSSFILARNEALLQRHLVIVRFLTMLVGAGGNAGNQASVRVIRGLAVGTVNSRTIRPFLITEMIMALCLGSILGVAGCIRAAVFLTPWKETFAITASLFMIVLISIVLGSMLPLLMKHVSIDPAHSSTTIQVIMDILGVCITVWMSSIVLGGSHSEPAAERIA